MSEEERRRYALEEDEGTRELFTDERAVREATTRSKRVDPE